MARYIRRLPDALQRLHGESKSRPTPYDYNMPSAF
jgi:hypothetical protein